MQQVLLLKQHESSIPILKDLLMMKRVFKEELTMQKKFSRTKVKVLLLREKLNLVMVAITVVIIINQVDFHSLIRFLKQRKRWL